MLRVYNLRDPISNEEQINNENFVLTNVDP